MLRDDVLECCDRLARAFNAKAKNASLHILHHRRPKLTMRGIDQMLMIYVRVSSETRLPQCMRGVQHNLSERQSIVWNFKIAKDD